MTVVDRSSSPRWRVQLSTGLSAVAFGDDTELPVVFEIADTTMNPTGSLGSFGSANWTS
ncbi:hypothetical protein ABH922_003887 [Rhodococcus sp. 27YEA15]|uniref:hypothetical protein n=1 Tax=Rhodococcus sp. 27YEA15 TaxID=3156259 RepID=UPI003C7D358B